MAKAEKNGLATKPIEATIHAPGHTTIAGYARDRIEVFSLTSEQSDALKRLTCSLRSDNARCARRDARTPDGKVVDNENDAVRWLLDRLAEEYAS
jgi:hypothetical protein